MIVSEMHSVAFAVSELFAGGAWTSASPASITIRLEAVLPNVDQVVRVYVALAIVGSDAGAGGYGSVGKDGGYAHSGVALVEGVPNFGFIASQEAFAGIVQAYFSFKAGLPDEV